jgi:hypothetical protein
MPGPETGEDDPRLAYLPCILVVTTNGVELAPLLPPMPTANVHWAQAWKPVTCQCGVVHTPCDPAALTLVIGPRDRTIHHHPDAFVVYAVPRPMKRVPENSAQVVHGGSTRFGEWAADVVLNLVGPLSGSIWRYDLADLRRMMIRGRSWSCVSASGDIRTVGDDIVGQVPSSADELHVSLCIPDDVTTELTDVFALLETIQATVRQDASIICSTSWGSRFRATIVHSIVI